MSLYYLPIEFTDYAASDTKCTGNVTKTLNLKLIMDRQCAGDRPLNGQTLWCESLNGTDTIRRYLYEKGTKCKGGAF